jgi:hypothetical protein
MRAIEIGNPFQVKSAQKFYLRSSETLRRLDLAVETERRTALEQIPMRQIEAIAVQISTWLRTAFEQLVGSESPSLMGINDLGEFKAYSVERFKGMHELPRSRAGRAIALLKLGTSRSSPRYLALGLVRHDREMGSRIEARWLGPLS